MVVNGAFAELIKEKNKAEVWGIEYMKNHAKDAQLKLDKKILKTKIVQKWCNPKFNVDFIKFYKGIVVSDWKYEDHDMIDKVHLRFFIKKCPQNV